MSRWILKLSSCSSNAGMGTSAPLINAIIEYLEFLSGSPSGYAFWHTVAFMEQRRLTLLWAFSWHLTSDTRRRLHSADSATLVVPSTRRTTYARWPCLSSGFRRCVEQYCLPSSVADDVPSWSEDCAFSVVVRSSLGDHYCTTLQPLSACGASACSFLLVSDCAVPLQCLWHESFTIISTCLLTHQTDAASNHPHPALFVVDSLPQIL